MLLFGRQNQFCKGERRIVYLFDKVGFFIFLSLSAALWTAAQRGGENCRTR
ncbi:hypothetical protein CLOSTASPAR_03320 [[Clostridium] asparagiforme DSM 15981]|uniref:Uncharacterized protein n=1 Tax=[Clostridium] asparagiforme DSM 15981 TaxID=518636 RepID=C0D231_9FIRM|nr:hypothetical protein CLOSTASPAR_03320 [[Clostridium] asparagiforme DSM 15981]